MSGGFLLVVQLVLQKKKSVFCECYLGEIWGSFIPCDRKEADGKQIVCVLFPMWSSKKILLNFCRVPNVYHEHAMVSSDIYIYTY